MIPSAYSTKYRNVLGFSNQEQAKQFFSGKDIHPNIDSDYLNNLVSRIHNIANKMDSILRETSGIDITDFCSNHIQKPYEIILGNRLIFRLNNQGRRCEEVLFSWLRGYVTCTYFTPIIAKLFNIEQNSILNIGEDNFMRPETFRRTPTADLEISDNVGKIRIEVQSGFQNVNDIKEHKIREAKRILDERDIRTVCVHIDIFNGQVAFVRLDIISDNDPHYITRQQMEGQSVFNINQNYFKWRLLDPLPNISEIEVL